VTLLEQEDRRTDHVELRPQVEVNCAVCGGASHELVCSAAEIRSQLAYLERFHRQRLRPRARRAAHSGGADEALADRADFTQDYATDVVSCGACGLVFRAARPRAAAITAAYARDEYGRERLEQLFGSQLELFRPRAGVLARLLTSRVPDVIEVGSFVGGFLAAARALGWNAVGVDPGAEVDEFCRAKGLSVVRATAAEAPIGAHSADDVAIWNTFDQLPDPRPTLTAARRWLRPGGILAIRVPNGMCFRTLMQRRRALPRPIRGAVRAAMAWNNLLGFPYLHGYSAATLDRLLRPFALRQIVLHPDTATRLADAQTKLWAAWEERLLKAAWRAVAKRQPDLAPWFDAYYRCG
jgi:SAM-dependent methyltransferase